MNKTLRKNIELGIAALSLLIAGASLASLTTSKVITNHAQYDTVDIALSAATAKDEDGDNLAVPNEKMTVIPEITNKAAVSYIRLKEDVKVIRKDGKEETFDQKDINGEGKDWKRGEDGRFYYMKKFPENGKSNITTSFIIPSSWSDEHMDGKIKVIITAEAIQSRNFADENSDLIQKWQGIKTEKTVRTRTYNLEVKSKK